MNVCPLGPATIHAGAAGGSAVRLGHRVRGGVTGAVRHKGFPASVGAVPLALFDLDNTLVDRQEALGAAVAALCRDLGYGRAIEAWMRTELARRAGRDDFARLREAFDVSATAGELWAAYVERMAAAVSCRPAVLGGLAELRTAGWTIGVVTNGSTDIQRAKLDANGLGPVVDGVAVSDEIGVRKPGIALFELAAARCGVSLRNGHGVMTGDDPAGDIGGGHAAGLGTIWVRGRPWPSAVPAPHHIVDDVLGAIDILLTSHWE